VAPSQAFALRPEYVRIVGNQSSREGSKLRLVVLHATADPSSGSRPLVHGEPGIKDLKRLGALFDDPQTEISANVANDAEGNDARYVRDRRKAWTQVAFNPVSLSVEQIGSSRFDRSRWLVKRKPQLENTARWIAHWHRRWDIPIRRAEVSGRTVVRSGVATHDQLGNAGGGHHDPGKGYPFRHVLQLARSFASQSTGP
jgi:hypothetical protein